MKIVISDYPSVMEDDYSLTIEAIKSILPEAEIVIHPFKDYVSLQKELDTAEGLITAFLDLDAAFFMRQNRLKHLSISAVGYGNVDLKSAHKKGIEVSHIHEYCTDEVATHTMALLLADNRRLLSYRRKIEEEHAWKFHEVVAPTYLGNQRLAIFGFGRIGRRVAEMAQVFGLQVMVVDPYVTEEVAKACQVKLVNKEEALKSADIISNHMNLTDGTKAYFDGSAFETMERNPYFINVGRGGSVDEQALIRALDQGQISGAGLDVLSDEDPELMNHPLVGRDNVILTPHSAFYSDESMKKLQTISAHNIAYGLTGLKEQVFKYL